MSHIKATQVSGATRLPVSKSGGARMNRQTETLITSLHPHDRHASRAHNFSAKTAFFYLMVSAALATTNYPNPSPSLSPARNNAGDTQLQRHEPSSTNELQGHAYVRRVPLGNRLSDRTSRSSPDSRYNTVPLLLHRRRRFPLLSPAT
jgi:hypothetical protein